MGLQFLAPLFLAALLAVAIPVLVHLTNRPRDRVLAFPSLMFLRRIQYRTVRRQKIRHWMLFLLRAGAVMLLAAAFARPLLEGRGAESLAAGSSRDLVIVLDQSMSMGYGDRWARATDAARRALASLGADDRGALVLFDDQAVQVDWTRSAGDLDAALAAARPTASSTRYSAAIGAARDLLQDATRPRQEVVLISDFQRSGWRGANPDDLRLPAGVTLTVEDVSGGESDNLAVAGVSLERRREPARERAIILARVVNPGSQPVRGLPVVLEVEGQVVATQRVDVDARGAAAVLFEPIVVSDRPLRAEVRLAGDDPLAADNVHHFVLAPAPPVRVLVVSARGAPADETLFLRRALELGADPAFTVTRRNHESVSAADLADQEVVLLSDVPALGTAWIQRLRSFVESGGGLFVALGRRATPESWQARGATLLPGTPGPVVDRLADRGARVSSLLHEHSAFEIFRTPRSGDVSSARIFRYRTFRVSEDATVLARFDDGAVALSEAALGGGRVVVWTSGLDNVWNDLPIQPVFLPFLHQLVSYLAGYRAPRYAYAVRDVLDVGPYVAASGRSDRVSVETPSGSRVTAGLGAGATALELREPGFYTVRSLGRNQPLASVAVNPDPAESDLAHLDPGELIRAVTPGPLAATTRAATPLTALERERRQGLWWYILLAVLLLLVAETVASDRLSVRRVSP